jgi:hypothetical protein
MFWVMTMVMYPRSSKFARARGARRIGLRVRNLPGKRTEPFEEFFRLCAKGAERRHFQRLILETISRSRSDRNRESPTGWKCPPRSGNNGMFGLADQIRGKRRALLTGSEGNSSRHCASSRSAMSVNKFLRSAAPPWSKAVAGTTAGVCVRVAWSEQLRRGGQGG